MWRVTDCGHNLVQAKYEQTQVTVDTGRTEYERNDPVNHIICSYRPINNICIELSYDINVTYWCVCVCVCLCVRASELQIFTESVQTLPINCKYLQGRNGEGGVHITESSNYCIMVIKGIAEGIDAVLATRTTSTTIYNFVYQFFVGCYF
jgi:hypothetical protein